MKMRTAQATGEFAVAFAFILFIFLILLATLNIFFKDNMSQGLGDADMFIDGLVSKKDMLIIAENEVTIPLSLPPTLDDAKYNITLHFAPAMNMTFFGIRMEGHAETDHYIYMPHITNSTPLLAGNTYKITKNSSGVFMGS